MQRSERTIIIGIAYADVLSPASYLKTPTVVGALHAQTKYSYVIPTRAQASSSHSSFS